MICHLGSKMNKDKFTTLNIYTYVPDLERLVVILDTNNIKYTRSRLVAGYLTIENSQELPAEVMTLIKLSVHIIDMYESSLQRV